MLKIFKPSNSASKSIDMTEGAIGRKLVLFMLPLLVGSLIQQLYNTVDLIFVGRLLGKEASAAVGSSSLLITCMVGFFTGLSIGASVVTARFFGGKKYDQVKKAISTAIASSFVGGCVLTLCSYILVPYFLTLLNTPEDIFLQAKIYARIYFLCLIPLVVYNISSGMIRAMGDSKSPLGYQLIGGIINILANMLFIWLLNWGLAGAAAASVISQLIAAVLAVLHLCNMGTDYDLTLRGLRVDRHILNQVLKIGIPAGVQATVITLSNLIVQGQINSLGVNSIAAFTAYFKVELLIYLPIMAIGQATLLFVGQNMGTQNIDRSRQGTKTSLLLGFGVTVFLSGIVILFSEQVFGLFLVDESVIHLGQLLARRSFPFYILYVILEVFSSAIRGLGRSLQPAIITIVNFCVVRVVLVILFMANNPTAEGVVLVYPITWGTTAACMYIFYKQLLRGKQTLAMNTQTRKI